MRIKLDENLPTVLWEWLKGQGHDAVRIHDERFTGTPDSELWPRILPERRLFITLDVAFGDLRVYPLGTHAGILLVRLSKQGPRAVTAAVQRVLMHLTPVEMQGSLIVVDDWRTRVRRPPV